MIGEIKKYFGGTKYIAGQTENGICFKDEDAFKSKTGICYIPEHGFDENGEVTLDGSLCSGLHNASLYTHNDIWIWCDKEVTDWLRDIEMVERVPFVEHVTELVFQTIDWQHPSTYLEELDIEEIYDDWKNNSERNDQAYLRDLLIQDLMKCEPSFTRKIATTIVNEMPYADILKRWDIDHVRVCSVCGKLMNAGYCLDAGSKYYCSDECLHTDFTHEEWKKECEENDQSYWTEWS